MKKIIFFIVMLTVFISVKAQVSKTNSNQETIYRGPGHMDKTFVYTAGDFGTCNSLEEVEISVRLILGTGTCTPGGSGDYGVHEDLNVRLVSPSGTWVDLVQDRWGYWTGNSEQTASFNQWGVSDGTVNFDDDYPTNVKDQSPDQWQSGNFRPHNYPTKSLSAFDGEDPVGTWTLRVSDGDMQFSATDYVCFMEATLTVTCGPACMEPDVPTVTTSPTSICSGNSSTLTISGNLNDATNWHIYTGSCGGSQIGTTATSSFIVSPTSTTTYYIRGEGGCVTPASCGTVTVNVSPDDDASFSYATAAYCVDAADPTPTITGLSGGAFSSSAGLSLNSSTGIVDLSASTPGTYSVTYTTTGTCPNSSNVSVTINALDDASFSYDAAAYCVDASDPTPTITGLSGGTFSSSAGLSLNTSTGIVDLSASTPGIYSVTYTTAGTCPNSSNVSVTINALDDASFSYAAAAYCVDASDPTPTITGLSGGTFSSTASLSLNTSTGVVDLSASTPGTYTVTYTTAGTCPNSSNVSVTINALDDASFSYAAAAYCVDASDPTPTITGLSGGAFSSSAGLSLNTSTGLVDLSASTPGTYSVTYTTTGTCPNSSNVSVTINALDDASFSYDAAAYCVDAFDPTPTITGLAGGTFSSTAGLSLNTSTGVVDLSASTPGTYTVTYTTAGSCPNSSNVSVTINALDDASFSYDASAYCVDASDPTPTITGLSGGTFTNSPAGLSLNASSGAIDVSASTPNTYTVTYTTAGTCPTSSNVSVTINALDDASFSYGAAAYCVDAADPTPTITGLSGGTFSSSAGLSLNASTGIVDLSTSTPGTYTATYTTAGTCPNSSNVSVTINALDDASFSYDASAYCVDASDPTPTITGLSGGIFSSSAGLSLNTSTGVIDLSASTPSTYTVTYTTAGSCPTSSNVSVTINALDDASFSYDASAYCVDASDPTPTITGLSGGTFSSTAGLSLNSSTGIVDLSTSTPGTYTATYTTAGTCPSSKNVSVTINALDDASFSYDAAAYCVDAADPTPTITGLSGGIFSSSAGLSLNASTGIIDLNASTPDTYTVTYTTAGTCPNSSNVSVTINALDDASFSYDASAYCVNASDPTPTITGLSGGTFSSTAGLSLNTSTGVVDLSASTSGTYSVTYTTTGSCPNFSNVSVTINALDDASFSYNASAYCVDAADPTPTITGLSGGTFSSSAGLSLNTSTGVVDLSASTPGTYSVTYTTAGSCPNSSNVSVTINALDDASFSYAAAAYCVDTADPTPTITGLSGGTFSSTAGLSLNTSTGVVDLSASTPGTYTVTYTTAGSCPTSSNVSVTINALDDASFSYDASAYCVDASDPTPTITGLAGGTFTSSPTGLSLNASSGAIDVSASTPNTYTVTYTTEGACPNSSNVNVTVNDVFEKSDQNITFSQLADLTYGDSDFNLTATASSGLPVSYSSSNTSVATINGNTVTIMGTGSTTITASQNGNASYNAAKDVQQVLIVMPKALTIIADDKTKVYDGMVYSPFTVSYAGFVTGEDDTDLGGALTFSGTATTATDVRSDYVITPGGLISDNYAITFVDGTLSITKAAQIITFNEIPLKHLETDHDFNLDATSSSGLAVTYSYSHSSTTAPAEVSPTGFVSLLASGEVEITVSQEGDNNYLPAEPVTRTMTIESSDASIHSITINGVTYDSPDQEIYYLIDCNDEQDKVEIDFSTEANATENTGLNFEIETPTPGIYKKEIQVTSQDGTNTRTSRVVVEKRFNYEDIVIQKYNNVLLVNNNPETNGGYRFTSFNWYKDGVLIGTGQYYSVGDNASDQLDLNAIYSVEMETEEGDILSTCESSITLKSAFVLKVAPNPVHSGSTIDVTTTYSTEMLTDLKITISNLYGVEVMQEVSDSNNSRITLPSSLTPGTYVVSTKAGGVELSTKIIVQ